MVTPQLILICEIFSVYRFVLFGVVSNANSVVVVALSLLVGMASYRTFFQGCPSENCIMYWFTSLYLHTIIEMRVLNKESCLLLQ